MGERNFGRGVHPQESVELKGTERNKDPFKALIGPPERPGWQAGFDTAKVHREIDKALYGKTLLNKEIADILHHLPLEEVMRQRYLRHPTRVIELAKKITGIDTEVEK